MAIPSFLNLNDALLRLANFFVENDKLPIIRSTVATTITLFQGDASAITTSTIFDMSNYTMTDFYFTYDGLMAGTTLCGLETAESAGSTGTWITLVQPTAPGGLSAAGVRRTRSNQNNLNAFVRAFIDKAGSTGTIMIVAHAV